MERLTFEGNFCDISKCGYSVCPHDGNCTQRQVWERLKDYEDAGLSPQACAKCREIEEGLSSTGYSISRMLELMKADKDGRVVVLERENRRGIPVDRKPFDREKPVMRDDGVIYCSVKEAAKDVMVGSSKVSAVCKGKRKRTRGYSFRYLTREEAEKALEARKDG